MERKRSHSRLVRLFEYSLSAHPITHKKIEKRKCDVPCGILSSVSLVKASQGKECKAGAPVIKQGRATSAFSRTAEVVRWRWTTQHTLKERLGPRRATTTQKYTIASQTSNTHPRTQTSNSKSNPEQHAPRGAVLPPGPGRVHHRCCWPHPRLSHLLGLVAQAVRLVRACGVGHLAHAGELAVLPRAHAEHEAEHIALLLPPQLLQVLVGSHACSPFLVNRRVAQTHSIPGRGEAKNSGGGCYFLSVRIPEKSRRTLFIVLLFLSAATAQPALCVEDKGWMVGRGF